MVTANVVAASASLAPLLEASHWEGRIAAVFETSLHLTGPRESLLHLQGGPLLVSPFGLRVSAPLASVLKGLSLVEGIPVIKAGCHILISGCLRLSLGETVYYRSPVATPRWVDPEALNFAKWLLTLEGRPGGFTAIPGTRAVAAAIHRSLTDGGSDRLLDATGLIVGLGPGLTPSGDDFLVGCLKGLWLLAGREPELHSTIGRLRSELGPSLSDRTTRVGAEFIRHALNGQFAEILDRAAEALLAPAKLAAVELAIRWLMAQGETSGTDTTQGLLACLDALRYPTCREPVSGRNVRKLGSTARP